MLLYDESVMLSYDESVMLLYDESRMLLYDESVILLYDESVMLLYDESRMLLLHFLQLLKKINDKRLYAGHYFNLFMKAYKMLSDNNMPVEPLIDFMIENVSINPLHAG